MKKTLLFLACGICALTSRAQYTFTGRIEYERKINLHRQMEGDEWLEKFKAQVPRFVTAYFDLHFTQNSALYQPGREPENPNPFARQMSGPASANVVFTDFSADKMTAAKEVFEQKFLVEDSIRTLRWKIDEEVRTIAGYSCRKAVGRMFDSVYVVAFYADAIPVSGGPEGFAGLPGMILEIAIPRLHATWIATKVELTAPEASKLVAPAKGKKTDTKGLIETVSTSMPEWMKKYAARNVWWITI